MELHHFEAHPFHSIANLLQKKHYKPVLLLQTAHMFLLHSGQSKVRLPLQQCLNQEDPVLDLPCLPKVFLPCGPKYSLSLIASEDRCHDQEYSGKLFGHKLPLHDALTKLGPGLVAIRLARKVGTKDYSERIDLGSGGRSGAHLRKETVPCVLENAKQDGMKQLPGTSTVYSPVVVETKPEAMERILDAYLGKFLELCGIVGCK